MDNNLLQIKIKQRLNKLDSVDYDNLECWQIAEAFNKAQIQFCRTQIHGVNQTKEGDESTKVLIDDMQILLTRFPIGLTSATRYYQTDEFPENYLWYKRIEAKSSTECCDPRNMKIQLEEEADVEEMLSDDSKKPSIEWNETFCTLAGNRVRIWTNDDFDVEDGILHYYRRPLDVQFEGCVNPSNDALITVDVPCEFKDDVAELILDSASSILAGDIESLNVRQMDKEDYIQNN